MDIARRIGVPEHSILERNPNLKDYQSVKSGQVINIPDTYSKKTELYIDKASLLPVKKLIYDDRGLYERYEFHYLNSKPGFTEKTFNWKIRIMDFEKEKVAFLRLALIQHYIPTKSILDLTRP